MITNELGFELRFFRGDPRQFGEKAEVAEGGQCGSRCCGTKKTATANHGTNPPGLGAVKIAADGVRG
jgi:hypothetical protein